VKRLWRCSVRRSFTANLKHSYFERLFTSGVTCYCVDESQYIFVSNLLLQVNKAITQQKQVGSLTGAVHLRKNSAGEPRRAQWEQKSHVELKGKSPLDLVFQCENKRGNCVLSILYACGEPPPRGARKVTTGITGLWLPSVQSDVAFWSFDVGSSHHSVAEGGKCQIVHL